MKKFKFSIRGNSYDVELKNIEDNVAEIEVNGSVYNVDIISEVKQKVSKTPRLVRGNVPPVGDSSVKFAKPSDKKGAGAVKAPIPGLILELKVKPGDQVKMGDTVVIMEAMKMENDIKADRSGTITEVKVKVNDSVLEGDVLVEIGD